MLFRLMALQASSRSGTFSGGRQSPVTRAFAEGITSHGVWGGRLESRVTGVTSVTTCLNSLNLLSFTAVTRSLCFVCTECYRATMCYS